MTDGTSFSTAGVFASISFAMSCLSALISIDGRQVAGFNLRVVADDLRTRSFAAPWSERHAAER